jgi:hypothetical protein
MKTLAIIAVISVVSCVDATATTFGGLLTNAKGTRRVMIGLKTKASQTPMTVRVETLNPSMRVVLHIPTILVAGPKRMTMEPKLIDNP